jgi:hypothetical protein
MGDTLRTTVLLGEDNYVLADGVGGCDAHARVLVGIYNNVNARDSIMAIDIASDSVVHYLPVGRYNRPSAIVYSAQSDRFYAGNYDSAMSVIAPDGSEMLHRIPVTGACKFLPVAAHHRVYVGTGSRDWVYVLRDSATGICEPGERQELPALAARPNPFRQAVVLSCPAGIGGSVRIWNAGSVLVRTLPAAGIGKWAWNGLDETGRVVAPGVYYARIDGAPAAAIKLVRLP